MARTELNIEERRQIERFLHSRATIDEIAQELRRHRSTIYREIKRNRFTDEELPYLDGYYGMTAQWVAAERRRHRRKLVRDPELRNAVIEGLEAGWSPEQIAGRMKHEATPVSVCHETIDAYVYSRDGQSKELVYRPSEILLMLQRRKCSDERDSGRRYQAVDGEA